MWVNTQDASGRNSLGHGLIRWKQHADGRVEGTVHLKKPYYRIGHLLEFGHAVENGGRTPIAEGKKTTVEGDDFIRPIAEKYEKQYEQKMKEMIGVVV